MQLRCNSDATDQELDEQIINWTNRLNDKELDEQIQFMQDAILKMRETNLPVLDLDNSHV